MLDARPPIDRCRPPALVFALTSPFRQPYDPLPSLRHASWPRDRGRQFVESPSLPLSLPPLPSLDDHCLTGSQTQLMRGPPL